jgi:hypothetical protein
MAGGTYGIAPNYHRKRKRKKKRFSAIDLKDEKI